MKVAATVMISSTFLDLPVHREKTLQACNRLGFHTNAMELTTATDRTTLTQSMKMVSESKIYILILGFRYGAIPPGKDESLTVLEFRRAQQLGLPCLIFCMSDDHHITRADVEVGPGAEKLARFKEEVKASGKVRAEFSNADQLMTLVIQSLAEERERLSVSKEERRSVFPKPPEPWAVHPYTLMPTNSLIGRQLELATLNDWIQNRENPILVLHAIGGMGKSAATWTWFRRQASSKSPQLGGSFWWSFYEANAGFDNFVIAALLYTTGRAQSTLKKLSYAKRLELLRLTLDREPFLLVLDGFERELNAYARLDATRINDDSDETPGAGSDASSVNWSRRGRNALDTRVGDFLRSLTTIGQSKILISSRIFPADLEGDTSHPVPGVISYELTGLNVVEAGELWRSLGVRGTKAALSRLFDSIQGYPLLVRAMAGQINNFRRAPGDFDAWQRANPGFNPYQLELKQRRTLVLEFALRGIRKSIWQVLSTIAALRMPAQYGFLVAVLVGDRKVCRDEQLLIRALEELETRGLVGWNRTKNTYDLHPIVRNVVWTKITTSDRRRLYSAIQKEFEAMPSFDNEDVKAVDDLFAPIELVRVLLEQELFGEAYDIYSSRLATPLERLGLFDKQKELLAPMFQGLDADDISEISSRLDPIQAEFAALRLAYVMAEGGDTKTALKLMQYHNKFCTSKTCRLHQLRVFYAEGKRNTGEHIIRSLLQDIRTHPDQYESDDEFYCLHFLSQFLVERNEISLAQLTFDRMRSVAKELSKREREKSLVGVEDHRIERWLSELEYLILMHHKDFATAVASAARRINLARKYKNELWLYGALKARFFALLHSNRLEEAISDLRAVMELSRTIAGISTSFRAETAQAELLFEQRRLDEAQELLKSLDFRFGSVLSLSDRASLLHQKGKVAVAQQNDDEVLRIAKAIIELMSSTGDCPRGYDEIEWAVAELNARNTPFTMPVDFPPALDWEVRLIDPAANGRGVSRH
jgi:hypothetical protein